ncbi:MAG: SDR family NAD(P)-dependent oxidoreductase, partial [Pseudomonadota bacterium]
MGMSFEGKSVIVTGAGYGVGLAIARRFAETGARVMFAGRDEQKLEKEVELLKAEAPGAVQFFAGDIGQKLEVANLMAATLDAFDRVDILINAHRDLQSSDPLDPDCKAFEELYTTNVLTPLR